MYVQTGEQRTLWNKVESPGCVVSWKGNLFHLRNKCSTPRLTFCTNPLTSPLQSCAPGCWENITLKGTHMAKNSNFHPCHMTVHLYYWANYIRHQQELSTCPFFVVGSQPYLFASNKAKFRKDTDCLLDPVNGKRPAFPTQRANNLFPGVWFLLEEPLLHSLLSLWYWCENIRDWYILKDL